MIFRSATLHKEILPSSVWKGTAQTSLPWLISFKQVAKSISTSLGIESQSQKFKRKRSRLRCDRSWVLSSPKVCRDLHPDMFSSKSVRVRCSNGLTRSSKEASEVHWDKRKWKILIACISSDKTWSEDKLRQLVKSSCKVCRETMFGKQLPFEAEPPKCCSSAHPDISICKTSGNQREGSVVRKRNGYPQLISCEWPSIYYTSLIILKILK